MPGLPAEDGRTRRRSNVTERWTLAAVLLDMDGTLLDTEKVYLRSTITALTACGYSDGVTELCHAMIGIPGPDCERMLRNHFGDGFPFDDVNRAFAAHCADIFEAGLPLKPRRDRAARCARCGADAEGDRHLLLAPHRRPASILGRHPRPFRCDPDPRRCRPRQAEPGSLSARCRTDGCSAAGLSRNRGFQSRCRRSTRRRRDHHHGARHRAAERRIRGSAATRCCRISTRF